MTYTFGPFTALKALHFPPSHKRPPPPPHQVTGWFLWTPRQLIRSFGLDRFGYHEFPELRQFKGDAAFSVTTASGPFSEKLATTVAALANGWIEDWNDAILAPGPFTIRAITLVCPPDGSPATNIRQFALLSTGGIITVGFGDAVTEFLTVAVQKATSVTHPYDGPFTFT